MKTSALHIISEKEYKSDSGVVLFEDEHSFSYGKIELGSVSLKFGWNSKGILPEVEFIENSPFVFIGVDTYVAVYNYEDTKVDLFLKIDSNFKWFDRANNGVAVVAETEIYIIDLTGRCTLGKSFSFGDIIMGTEVENGKMRISFLVDKEVFISI